jgi:hypothetical protein
VTDREDLENDPAVAGLLPETSPPDGAHLDAAKRLSRYRPLAS